MPTVKLRFPGGRYHATPWGHHVNEGLIEWPPSPWRLLRALLACGFSKGFGRATACGIVDLPPLARSLLETLASVLPSYKLPDASAAHTRHYMPYIEGKNQKTTLVWDTFADIGDGALYVHYPCALDSDQIDLLAILTRNLGYLGRAESWVEGELIAHDTNITFDSRPCDEGQNLRQGFEQVSLVAAMHPQAYVAWREERVAQATAQLALPSGKKKSTEPFPPDLLHCLTQDTAWWKGHGWSQPPGSRRVLYWRPADPLKVSPPVVRRRPTRVEPVDAMLLAITTPTGRQSPLPSVTRTLPQAEMIHRSLVSIVGRGDPVDCPELTGKDADGRPLQNDHRHAHVLPLSLDRPNFGRRLDHILIYAKMRLRQNAQQAIRSLRRTWTKGGVGDLQLSLVGQGSLRDLHDLPERLNDGIERLLGPIDGARTWVSLTPFVAPRHLKRAGSKDALVGQVLAELRSRGLPDATVEVLPLTDDRFRHFRHFVRCRARRSPPPADRGYAFRLTFEEPVRGPISLGYASHFGLGMMAAVERDRPL